MNEQEELPESLAGPQLIVKLLRLLTYEKLGKICSNKNMNWESYAGITQFRISMFLKPLPIMLSREEG